MRKAELSSKVYLYPKTNYKLFLSAIFLILALAGLSLTSCKNAAGSGGGSGDTGYPDGFTFYVEAGYQWEAAINAINSSGDYKHFYIDLWYDVEIPGYYNSTFSNYGISITINGNGYNLYLNDSSTGSLLRIHYDQTIYLQSVYLVGHSGNNSPLVNVDGGAFIMQGGSVSGNSNNGGYGGGVSVGNGGSFTMNGGTISGNSAYYGGGVFVDYGGNFYKYGGTVYGNDALPYYYANSAANGAALYTSSGTVENGTLSYYGTWY